MSPHIANNPGGKAALPLPNLNKPRDEGGGVMRSESQDTPQRGKKYLVVLSANEAFETQLHESSPPPSPVD